MAPRSAFSPTVLQVLPALGDGGVEQSAIDMALYIKKRGWRPLVASAGGGKVDLLANAGVLHVRLPLAGKMPWTLLTNAWRLAHIIKAEKVDLVHARSRAPAWSAWLASRFCGASFVTTFHGTYGLGGGWLKRFYNSVMVRGPVVIANSAFIKNHIVEKYHVSPSRIVVAARGVREDVFDPALFNVDDELAVRREQNVPEGVPILVVVGRLTRWKGQDVLLRALALIKDRPWALFLVGGPEKDGSFAREIERLSVDLGLQGRVRLMGSRKDVARLLNAGTLALSCSVLPEAFGRAAIEGMAMGLPVVATALGGSLETVIEGKTGWLVKPGKNGEIEPQALAQTIGKALRDPARLARMGQAARAHVLAHFTAEKCCAAEMEAYMRVLPRR